MKNAARNRDATATTPRVGYTITDGEAHDNRLDHLHELARLLDTAFTVPGTKLRIGLDPIIGLIPGIGDFLGALLSTYIIMKAARLGAARSVLARMGINVGIETVVGAIPILGDLFDAAWKANTRNLALLESHLAAPHETRRKSWVVVGVVALAAVMLLVGVAALGVLVLRVVYGIFT